MVQERPCRARANGRLGICETRACRAPDPRPRLELALHRHSGWVAMHVPARAEPREPARYSFAADSLPADRGWQACHFPRRLAAPWKLRDWKLRDWKPRDWKLRERMAASAARWSWMRPVTFVIDPARAALSPPHSQKKPIRSAWLAPSTNRHSIRCVRQYRARRQRR